MASQTIGRTRADSDPLARALQPSAAETAEDKVKRLQKEQEARKISEMIDEQLRQEKALKAKKRKEVKILLLGQSESGKSTTLKQFQLIYSPNAFSGEAPAWRPIVYLNLVRSVRRILEALTFTELEDDYYPQSPTRTSDASSSSYPLPTRRQSTDYGDFADIRQQLAPLLDLEEKLVGLLAPPEEDEATQLMPLNSQGGLSLPEGYVLTDPKNRSGVPIVGNNKFDLQKEVAVRANGSSGGWKKAFGKFSSNNPNANGAVRGSQDAVEPWANDPEDPVHVLVKCKDDMVKLWADQRVQAVLKKRKIRLEESSGFYLDSIERVTSYKYVPTVDDVLRARIKTLGVIEHRFTLEKGQEKGVDWVIYDVGGARNQRQAWAPFFDDVNALIFLAPISAFDQVLAEDPDVNRVEDSLLLWRSVVSNKLLAHVNIILFLNKCDLLEKKLNAGVRLAKYMTSYAERPNDYESVAKYFKSKFGALHRSYSPNQERELYVHLTSVTDTHTTSAILINVRDMILKNSLKSSNLI